MQCFVSSQSHGYLSRYGDSSNYLDFVVFSSALAHFANHLVKIFIHILLSTTMTSQKSSSPILLFKKTKSIKQNLATLW